MGKRKVSKEDVISFVRSAGCFVQAHDIAEGLGADSHSVANALKDVKKSGEVTSYVENQKWFYGIGRRPEAEAFHRLMLGMKPSRIA